MATIALMETAATATEGGTHPIPLQCVLCPKKPKFSDTSHLLTHISSKSHLHHKFSAEFKSKSDPSSLERLQRYEQWYAVNRIERLLSDRIAAKGQRKPSRRGRVGPAMRKSGSEVDALKAEAASTPGYHTPAHLPPVGHWHTAPGGGLEYSGIRDDAYLNGSLYQSSPLAVRHRSVYPYPDDVSNGSDLKHGQYGVAMDTVAAAHSTTAPSEMDVSFGSGLDAEAQDNKLKGIVWPGMDLFDAATPDQKKKRNQRKDEASLDLLKVSSEAITATEMVWGPEGDVRKTRDIYASPSIEGTPPSTPPRKRKQRSRASAAASGSTPPGLASKPAGADDASKKKRRTGRSSQADAAGGRQTRAAARATDQVTAAATTTTTTTATIKPAKADGAEGGAPGGGPYGEESVYSLTSHKSKSSFHVFYENGNNNSPAVDSHVAVADGTHENGIPQNGLPRPALQQLDPNLSISEAAPYFKHPSSSARFFDNAGTSPHMTFRGPAATYGGDFQDMGGSTANALYSQPRSGGMYPTYDSPLFHGSGSGDGSAPGFHAGGSHRRMGFGGFDMDGHGGAFGYHDQREADPHFSDAAFPGSARLFEM